MQAAILLFLLLASAVGAQSDWTWRFPLPQGHHLYGVVWTGNRFVAVGEHGMLAVSGVGDAWSASWSGSRNRLYAVAWAAASAGSGTGRLVAEGAGQLVAVGDSGTILTSFDAATWTERSSGTTRELFGVAHGSGMFVAVGNDGTILSSPDALTWTRRESGVDNPLLAVAWADTQFVAVSGGVILTSPDGRVWRARTVGAHAPLRGVGWGNGRIVVVGDDATILTSEDGVTWTLRQQAIVQLRGVAWTGDGFLATGKYGYVRTSPDGIEWDSAYVGNDEDYFAVACGTAGRAVTVGNAGSIAAMDAAGRWSVRSDGVRKTMRSIAGDGRGRYVAVGEDGTVLHGDGETFSPESLGTVNGFRTVVWAGPRAGSSGDGHWVAAGWLGLARSEDGKAWEAIGGQRYDPRFDIRSLAWMDMPGAAAGTLIAVGAGGIVQTSPDGIAWTLRDSGRAADLNAVAWSGTRLVAVGAGPILTSPDARIWSVAHPDPGVLLHHVAAGEGQFLAVGAGGTILTSPDGMSWAARVSGTLRDLHGAAWTGRQWVVTGEAGLVLRSPDGIAWSPEGYMGGSTLYAVLWTGAAIGPGMHTLLAVGAEAAVLSAVEDPAAGIRIRPSRPADPFMAMRAGRLHVPLPDDLRGHPVRLSVYGISGARRLDVRGRFSREAMLPLSGLPAGTYVLEIRGGERRIFRPFEVSR